VCLIDPHGDFAEEVINHIPKSRRRHTVYFNAGDKDYPTGFNPLEIKSKAEIDYVASAVLAVFKNLWADSWEARMEDLLRNSLLALLEAPRHFRVTLLSIPKMIQDRGYRTRVLEHCTNQVVLNYWENTFENFRPNDLTNITSPVTNKVNAFSSMELMQNILGQAKNTFDLRRVMNDEQILIVNLAKGKVGADNSNLLGSLVVSSIQAQAMARIDQAEPDRKPFHCVIDEFQNFSTDSFAEILSEARKFGLSMVIAHQYVKQLKENVKNAVLGNVETLVLFALSGTDSKTFEPEVSPLPVQRLTEGEVGEGILIRNSDPVFFKGLPPLNTQEKTLFVSGSKGKVIKNSRRRFALEKRKDEKQVRVNLD